MNRFRIALISLSIVLMLSTGLGQQTIPLWPKELGPTDKDNPTLTIYKPDSGQATGAAIVICPGGAYRGLAKHEGEDYALFLAKYGITAFVLKYRLGPTYTYREITADAARAIRIVRAGARTWNLQPDKIGIMGSSAGGHLASTMVTHFDGGSKDAVDPIERVSSRPDFGILCYAVISMGPLSHRISREMFLGANPSDSLVRLYSNELQVTPLTPPCFVWHTAEDSVVSVENSIEFAKALKKNNVPFDLHIYEKGRHGLGLGDKFPFQHPLPWTNELIVWLRTRGAVR